MTPQERLQGLVKAAGYGVTSMLGMGAMGREAVDNPATTLVGAALPVGGQQVARVAGPYVGPGIRTAGKFLEQPLVGGMLGAMHGYNRGGLGGAVEQGLYGAVGGSVLGRALTAAGTRLSPGPPPPPSANAGGRLVPRSTPSMQQVVSEGLEATRTPVVRVPGVSLPEQGPGPSVTLSPQAQRAAAGRPLVGSPGRAPGVVQPAPTPPRPRASWRRGRPQSVRPRAPRHRPRRPRPP